MPQPVSNSDESVRERIYPNSVPGGAAKFKPCTDKGLRSVSRFLPFRPGAKPHGFPGLLSDRVFKDLGGRTRAVCRRGGSFVVARSAAGTASSRRNRLTLFPGRRLADFLKPDRNSSGAGVGLIVAGGRPPTPTPLRENRTLILRRRARRETVGFGAAVGGAAETAPYGIPISATRPSSGRSGFPQTPGPSRPFPSPSGRGRPGAGKILGDFRAARTGCPGRGLGATRESFRAGRGRRVG